MLWFTECKSGDRVSVNPEYIVAVFIAREGEMDGKTIINLINGQIAVEESPVLIVGQIEGAK